MDFPIDFVVTWVDGSDPKWAAKKNKYMPEAGTKKKSMNSVKAYREWGTFKYWFRGVEKFAPWVNKVYLVTDQQIPSFLDLNCAKIQVVDHTDFLEAENLPVFNVNPIETNLHRIKGLSEHFVFFNDDMYLTSPVEPTDFFSEDGKPKSRTAIMPILPERYGAAHFQVNALEIVTDYFSKQEIIKNAQLLSPKQGLKNLLRTWLYKNDKYFWGFLENHLPYALCKSTYEELWAKEPAVLQKTAKSKFRSKDDVTVWLFKYWQFASGNCAVNDAPLGKLFTLDDAGQDLWNLILSHKYKIMCINDGFDIQDEDQVMTDFIKTMDTLLPQKSQFEK